MTTVDIIRPEVGLTPATAAAIFALINMVWPPAAGAEARDPSETLAGWNAQNSTHFVIGGSDANSVLAHAMLFRREIFTQSGPLYVGALAAVCVHPDSRGCGWGADVVRAAFDYLPELGVEVSLFQTGVQAFYEKLGARRIANRFFDGTRADGSKSNPFWDTCAMIYPASFAWPDGDIDLNGAGY